MTVEPQPVVEVPDQGEDGLGCLGVQGGSGLVAEKDFRLGGQGPGDGHPLLLAAGELGGVGFQLVVQAHQLQELHAPLFGFGALDAGQLQGEADVFQAVPLHQQVEALEDHGDVPALLPQLRLGELADVLAVDEDFAAGGALQHVDAADQGAFSRAAHADDAVDFAVADGQRDVLEGLHRAVGGGEGLGKVLDFNHSDSPNRQK